LAAVHQGSVGKLAFCGLDRTRKLPVRFIPTMVSCPEMQTLTGFGVMSASMSKADLSPAHRHVGV
jgi:hypothetical protein